MRHGAKANIDWWFRSSTKADATLAACQDSCDKQTNCKAIEYSQNRPSDPRIQDKVYVNRGNTKWVTKAKEPGNWNYCEIHFPNHWMAGGWLKHQYTSSGVLPPKGNCMIPKAQYNCKNYPDSNVDYYPRCADFIHSQSQNPQCTDIGG